jgi:hypothetical protein
MINFAKVQLSTFRTLEPAQILAPLVGKFNHVAISGADTDPPRFAALVQAAAELDVGVLWWACPGYWNVMNLPKTLSIKAAWPDAPRDWPNFSLQEVRSRTVAYISDFANHNSFAGVLLDYIRYPWGPIRQRPDLFSADDITATVQQIRQALDTGKILVANVGANYEPVGQQWPDWLSYDIVDEVSIRCYVGPQDLPAILQQVATDPTGKGICVAPGGTNNLAALDAEQVTALLVAARDRGFPHVSVFDWKHATDGNYWPCFPNLPPVEQPPAEPQLLFEATLYARFWDDGQITLKWETLG